MYAIKGILGGKTFVLSEPYSEEQVVTPVLKEIVGKSGTLEFDINLFHPNYEDVVMYKTYIRVERDGEEVWYGRVINISKDFYNTKTVICEGELGLLNDSIQASYGYSGTVRGYIDYILGNHNSQVEEEKRIYTGNIIVSDSNDYIHRENNSYTKTLEELDAKLPKLLGGYLKTRHENGVIFLDYLWNYGDDNTQIISVDENLIDYESSENNNEFYTRLIPTGAKVNEVAITIKTVNGGVDYIENPALIERYGVIVGTKSWDDVTLPENLLRKARKEILSKELPNSFKLSAVDLSHIDNSKSPIKVGRNTKVISPFHKLETMYFVTEKESHLDEPERDVFTFGMRQSTYTAKVSDTALALEQNITREIKDTALTINNKLDDGLKTITGVKGGAVVLDTFNENGDLVQPWRILVMDTANKTQAVNVIQINQNGIGFSRNGINGEYLNAWTIDGHLRAEFIDVGTMLADRIRGGTLEVGGDGTGRDGQILVKSTINEVLCVIDKNGISVNKGTIKGSSIEGNSIKGGSIEGTTITGSRIVGDNIEGGTIKGSSIEGNSIKGGSIEGTIITGSRIAGDDIEGGTIKGATIEGNTIKGGSVEGTTITGSRIVGDDIEGGTIKGSTIEGNTIRGGSITGTEIEGGSDIHFSANSDNVKIGDFEVRDTSRHILQSSDECTGMSGADGGHGRWYLWAGYQQGGGSENTVFIVNDGQVRVEGELIVNGEEIEDMIYRKIRENGS
nr:phage tail spike protein [uncultured Lachnoanaerobaculum sp.]